LKQQGFQYANNKFPLLKRIKRLLRRNDVFPKKRLGQNFIVDESLIQRMINYASISQEDIVLEIGAGFGFLTKHLAKRCKQVLAVEVDKKLVRALRRELKNLKNVNFIEGDILKVYIPLFNKVVSTPPYSISSPLLFWLLEKPFKLAVLTFQKEFGERLTAPIGSRSYSRLTVTTYYRAEVEVLENVPKTAFYPPPEVDSVIIRLKPRETPPFKIENPAFFHEMLQVLFTQRNKKLRNAVTLFLHRKGMRRAKATKIADSLLFHDKRVRELAPEDIGAIANELHQKIKRA
jgi:16S rRNA (adenine1518-N6/adenine1519-N6)-dimethyltransferase